MIRAYSLDELFCMTRAELFAPSLSPSFRVSPKPRPTARSPSIRFGTSAVCSRAWRRVHNPSTFADLRCARDLDADASTALIFASGKRSSPMDLTDVRRTAQDMIDQFGDAAANEASKKAEAELDVGEREAHRFWSRVVLAIGDLRRSSQGKD